MNVPPFFIQRDVVRQTSPRLSAVFKQTHLGQTMQGIYKMCVATNGSVYAVTPVKSVPGADEDIIQGLKGGVGVQAPEGPGVLPLQPPHHHPVSAAARGGGPLR